MQKQTLLNAAEVFDSWRVVPRTFLYGYWITTFYLIFWVFWWYMHLDANGRGNQESGLIGVVVLTLVKFGIDIFNTYTAKGRDWTIGSDSFPRGIGPNQQVVVQQPPTPTTQ